MRATLEPVCADPGSSFRCFRRQESHYAFLWHFHPEYELTLIERGRGRRFIGDHCGDYSQGDLVLLGPNIPHTWRSLESASSANCAVVVQFRKESFGSDVWNLAEFQQVTAMIGRSRLGIRFLGSQAETAGRRLQQLPELTGMERLAEFLRVLGRLAQCKQTETLVGQRYSPSLSGTDSQRIEMITSYLLADLRRAVPQHEAARLVHMSASSFSRFCRRVLGRTFVEYAHELRLSEACRLLIETERSVTQIAHDVGYNNMTYFSRRFRAYRGMTARAYRRAYVTQVAEEDARRVESR